MFSFGIDLSLSGRFGIGGNSGPTPDPDPQNDVQPVESSFVINSIESEGYSLNPRSEGFVMENSNG